MTEQNDKDLSDFIKEMQREHTENEIKCRIRKLESDIENDKERLNKWLELKMQESQIYKKSCYLTNVFNFLTTFAILILLFTMIGKLS